MHNLTSTLRQLIVPVLFAAVAGVVVALLVGGVDIKGIGSKIGKSVSGISNIFKRPNPSNSSNSSNSSFSSSDYVAVYMENSKVYFGKMEGADSDEPKLTDVFTLNVSTSQAEGSDTAQTDFELVKMTDQFQSPTDLLVLSRNKILYWEPLKSDSRVVEAIKKYKEGK
ncbi:MAG: hypothetical protein AAB823_00420 [Patescibacteria group bacterium]